MKQRYNALMSRLVVTPAMRRRILQNLQQAKPEPRALRPAAQRLLALAACLAVLAAGLLALPRLRPLPPDAAPGADLMGMAPVEVDSAQALAQLVGFSVPELTDLPFAVEERLYTVYAGTVAEVLYSGAGQTAALRKSPGTEDNSGDYTEYPRSQTLQLGGLSVLLKGEQEGYRLALWTDGDYAYSLLLSHPLSAEGWQALLCGLA